MFAAIGSMSCPSLAVPAEVMAHVVDVESGANPYAIGVVGGQLERQPKNLAEALATVHMLDAKGYNYSLGVAQVNRANLGKYGLDSYEKAFEPCPNLAAGAQILAACYTASGNDWGKAFSCYYSGNFTTGFRDGYVQKVYASINRSHVPLSDTDAALAIALKPSPAAANGNSKMAVLSPNDPGYRTAIRSVKLYPAVTSATSISDVAVDHVANTPAPSTSHASPVQAAVAATTPTPAQTAKPTRATVVTTAAAFVPQVTGPNDPLAQSAPASQTATPQVAAATTPNTPTVPAQEPRDAAFVF